MFSQDCLASARAALSAHKKCSEQYNVKGSEDLWNSYVHWYVRCSLSLNYVALSLESDSHTYPRSILQAPFTPFIVIFCYAISTCSHSDLTSLSEFVLSLESCRTVSEGAEKLYKLCHLFLSVAKLYVEAKSKEALKAPQNTTTQSNTRYYTTADGQQFDLSEVNQFDPYLSALGLVPNAAWPMTDLMAGSPLFHSSVDSYSRPQEASVGGQNSVQDWFSGSRYILGLMEDDINMPDLNTF